MKRIKLNLKSIPLLAFVFILLLGIVGCDKSQIVIEDTSLSYIEENFKYSEEITIWDIKKENYVISIISSNDLELLEKEIENGFSLETLRKNESDNEKQITLEENFVHEEIIDADLSMYVKEINLEEGKIGFSIRNIESKNPTTSRSCNYNSTKVHWANIPCKIRVHAYSCPAKAYFYNYWYGYQYLGWKTVPSNNYYTLKNKYTNPLVYVKSTNSSEYYVTFLL